MDNLNILKMIINRNKINSLFRKFIGLSLLYISFSTPVFSQDSFSLSDQLINTTIRIKCKGDTIINGKKNIFISSGTGFFFAFKIDTLSIPVIVTNYHVVHNTDTGIFRFTVLGENDKPKYGTHEDIVIEDFENQWIKHPREDLAIMFLQPLINKFYRKTGKMPYYVACSEDFLPSKEISKEITAIEEVIMIGYPKGIWDVQNNLPVVRRGLTATPFYIDYQGEEKFLLDIPIYEGSSGSPIIIYEHGIYAPRTGRPIIGTQLVLLGINVQSVNSDFEGTTNNPNLKTKTKLPVNIAVAIKSSALLDFKPLIMGKINKKSP